MPTYVVTGPDGKRYRVSAPEGATPEQVRARVQSQQPKSTKTGSAVSGFGDMMTFGFLDELGAVADTLGLPAGEERPTIWNGSSFGDAWRQNQRRNSQILKQAESDNPKTYLAGQVAGALVPAFMGGGAAAGRLANAPKAVRAARAVAPSVAQGAAYGAGSTNGGLRERAKGAVEGAAWGLGGDLAGRAVGKVVSRALRGKQVPRNVRILADADVTLTPGQRAGKGSIRNVFEDKVLGSLPFVGDVPAAARLRGENDLRRAVANEVLDPIGAKIPRGTQIDNAGIAAVQELAGAAYDNSIDPLNLRLDDGISSGMDDIVGAAQREVGPEGASQLGAYTAHLKSRLAEGLSGEPLKRELQALRGVASETGKKDPMLAQKFWELHNTLDNGLAAQSGDNVADAYRNARETMTRLNRLNAAAAGPGVVNGEFGPTQLLSAMKKRGYGTTTANIASGDARLFDLANASADVMRNTTANSGTVPRALAGGGLLGGAAAGAASIDPILGTATGASLLGYIPGIDRFLQDIALRRSDRFRRAGEAVSNASPYLGRLGMGGALGLFGSTP